MPGKGPIMPMAWEPQLLKDAKKKARPHGSSAGRRAPERGRTTKSRKMRDQPRDVDEMCEECSDHFNCASQIYDLLACNYHPTSYCVMTLFLVGTLSWNVGIASHVHNRATFTEPFPAHSHSSLEVVEDSSSSRNKLRCLNLDSMWRKQRGSGEDKTDEELLLWHSLNCDELLRDTKTKGPADDPTRKMCKDLESRYHVNPGRSWGYLPRSLQDQWKRSRCDCYTDVGCELVDENERGKMVGKGEGWLRRREQIPYSITAEGIWDSVRRRPAHIGAQHNGTDQPVIAILVPTTSRGFRWKSLDQVPVVRFLLPSVARTVESGFIYRVYVGFDLGDLYFDHPARIAGLAKTFQDQVANPARLRGISCALVVQGFQNSLRKPGPMFNFLSSSALADGADYVYRINDDTELRSLWASAFVLQLAAFNPPNVGVVGPTCKEGNLKILTHDFVHKTHAYIFSVHYPSVLMDWYSPRQQRLINTVHLATSRVQGYTACELCRAHVPGVQQVDGRLDFNRVRHGQHQTPFARSGCPPP